MINRIWLLALTLISISALGLAMATRLQADRRINPTPLIDNSAEADEALKRAKLAEAKVAALEYRLSELERRPTPSTSANSTSLDAIDANIEALVRSSSQNTQEVQKISQQVRSLTESCQGAFNAVAAHIQEVRGEVDKLTEKTRQK